MKPFLGISWSISNLHGWGNYGLNILFEIFRRGEPFPICFEPIVTDALPDDLKKIIQPAIDFQSNQLSQLRPPPGQVGKLDDTIILHSMGNNLVMAPSSEDFRGQTNVGIVFFEHSHVSPEQVKAASELDFIISGSSWNANVLDSFNLKKTKTIFQGVNTKLFRPRPKKNTYNGKFTIFSGGKLEFRKGQDIVLKAFKIFSEKHTDALLVTAWHNLWAHHGTGLEHSPHIKNVPTLDDDGNLMISKWASDNGIGADKFIDLGFVPNNIMPEYLTEMDLALFPNRCEGGTNLVAMEAMSCGVPVIIAANTGQLDLIDGQNCYVLSSNKKVKFPGYATEGWGESSVEELVDLMEEAYTNSRSAKARGLIGSEFIQKLSWENQIGELFDFLEEF